MAIAVLITGGNRGDVARSMESAEELIEGSVGRVIAKSSIRESRAWGEMEGGSEEQNRLFLNRVLVVETELKPMELLRSVQRVEKRLGRVRSEEEDKNSKRHDNEQRVYRSRTIDIDILLYDDLVIKSRELEIPHPMMHLRGFVLEPLSEVMPDYRDPKQGETIEEMLKNLREKEDNRR